MKQRKREVDPKGKVTIYGMTAPGEYKIVYVGSTRNLKSRVSTHISDASHVWKSPRRTPLHAWIRDIVAKGGKPELYLLEECTEENRNEREEWWIAYMKSIRAKLFNARWVGTKVNY